MQLKPKLRTRLLLPYFLPTAVAMALIGGVAYSIAWRALEQSLGERLASIALGLAISIRSDDVSFLRPGDEESRTYRRVRERLGFYQDALGVERVLVFDPLGNAIADSEGAYPIGSRIGDLSRDSIEVESCLRGEATSSQVIFTGLDGRRYKTGYAPVISADGEVVAGVAVDGSAVFFEIISQLGRRLSLLGLFGVLSIVVVSFAFSGSLTKPITGLVSSAGKIGDGDLETPIPHADRNDELGDLAISLETMRSKLKARERELQMMLAGIAHEVRNPLGGIELFTGLLAEELQGDDEKMSYLNRVRKEMAYLADLVNEFLDYARDRPLDLCPVSPRELVSEIEQLVRQEAVEAEVTIEVIIHEERTAAADMKIMADPGMLRRALLNIVSNSLQAASRPGLVTVEVGYEKNKVVFTVSDDGEGVPDDIRERVFEPFFTTREKGSGLGLALVQKAAQAHGGVVRIVTGEKKGGVFQVLLPTNNLPHDPKC